MKIQKTFFALLLLAASTIFVGCNANKFDVAPETSTKTEYTASEKAEIYALAEKYELELSPMERIANQPLKSISELEERFKQIYEHNNTEIPLTETKDGSRNAKKLTSSKRIKTRNESGDGGGPVSVTFLGVLVNDDKLVTTDISVGWENSNTDRVNASCNYSYSEYYSKSVDCSVVDAYKTPNPGRGGYFYLTINSRDRDYNQDLGNGKVSGEIIDGYGYISGSGYSLMVSGL